MFLIPLMKLKIYRLEYKGLKQGLAPKTISKVLKRMLDYLGSSSTG
jgi:hypothetical protein